MKSTIRIPLPLEHYRVAPREPSLHIILRLLIRIPEAIFPSRGHLASLEVIQPYIQIM